MATKSGWITRKANQERRKQEALDRIRGIQPPKSSSLPAKPHTSAPSAIQSTSASPELEPRVHELARRDDLAEYRRSVFGSATDDAENEPVVPVEPIVAPPTPRVCKRIWEYEGRFYEDAQMTKQTDDIEKYVCSRGLCYRTRLHKIEIELVFVPPYPRHTIGVEYELDDSGIWRPKPGQALPYANTR